MSDARPPIAPTSEMPLEVACEELTGFEVLAIERRYGGKLEELGGTSLAIGVVWALENRTAKKAWSVVEAMTLRELGGYFPDSPDDVDPNDPDSDLGKGSTPYV